ncbi:MAG: NAD-dependent epimerase/dehydratase family protein [Rhodospirillaceae bacterium]
MIHVVTGAAGFVGSHLVDALLAQGDRVAAVGSLRLGTRAFLAAAQSSPAFGFAEADCSDAAAFRAALRGLLPDGRADMIWHMAANADIRAGVGDPDVDLRHTFLTTHEALRMAREFGVRRFAFASTSAVYGERSGALTEDSGPLNPISNYGAMKLAAEAAVSAATARTLDRAWIFRFPNVVGSRATHGVIYDFMHKLKADPTTLEVLGDGTQQKPYLHVAELIAAVKFIVARANDRLNVFNVSSRGPGTTVRFIAEEAVRVATPGARIRYTGGDRGWVGDVPKFSYSTDKLAALGWSAPQTSDDAVRRAVRETAAEILGV